MARIVHMDVLAPDPIDFDMGDGRVFHVNTNLPVEQMLRFAKLEDRLIVHQQKAAELRGEGDAFDEAAAAVVSTLEALCAEVLAVLQVSHPELAECPFDHAQIGVFLSALRGHIEEQLGPDPTPPSPTPAGKTAKRPARRKSTPSSGSRASASNSAGRRTTGGR